MSHDRPRITAIDVALRAGVSQPTVSRALRGEHQVREETRQRVLKAAQELNYVVDQQASSLRREQSGTLALIVICRPGEDRSSINPFYFSLLGSIAAAAAHKGHNLLVSFQDSNVDFNADFVAGRLADAMIVIGTTHNDIMWNSLRAAQARGMRFVCWGSPGAEFDWVRSDNFAGGRLAALHLIEQGCRNIAFVGPLHSAQQQFDERFAGFSQTLMEHGLSPIIIEPGLELDRNQQGRDAVRQLVDSKGACDGIFAACDMIALGVLHALKDTGVKVPGQIRVVGFDAIRAACFSDPDLTTIEPDLEIAGRLLVDLSLSNVIKHAETDRRAPVRLIERGSSVAG